MMINSVATFNEPFLNMLRLTKLIEIRQLGLLQIFEFVPKPFDFRAYLKLNSVHSQNRKREKQEQFLEK